MINITDKLYRGIKIRIIPTPEQEVLFWKSAGVARWSYNYVIGENERVYQEYLAKEKQGPKFILQKDLVKYINNTLKPTTHTWLNEVGGNVKKQGIKDAYIARDKWFKGLSKKPRMKSKNKSKPAFYVNYASLKRTKNGFSGERLGIVTTTKPLPKIPKGTKYSNPRISFDGKYWYLGVVFKINKKEVSLSNTVLGVDVGIKDLAIVSNGKVYKNINKTKHVRQLEKRLIREQRKLSRKQEAHIISYAENRKPIFKKPLNECKNWKKQLTVVQGIYKELTDIRNNHLHQTTSEIVKTKPSKIVVETLNVKGMMKNKHVSKALSNQKLYEFKRQLEYKCENYGIDFIQADMWFPSSKLCSDCGFKKVDLRLSDRIYCCENCGLKIDRDYNASLNLANY